MLSDLAREVVESESIEQRREAMAEILAEVERLREAAVVGEAIERGLAMEDGDRGEQGLSLTRQQEGRESTYRVFGYRITGRGYLDTVPARKTVEARTLAAALRDAGLMEVNGGAV